MIPVISIIDSMEIDGKSLRPSFDLNQPLRSIWLPEMVNIIHYREWMTKLRRDIHGSGDIKICCSDIQPYMKTKHVLNNNNEDKIHSKSLIVNKSTKKQQYNHGNNEEENITNTISLTKLKTKMCSSWLTVGCHLGNNCEFSHTLEDLIKQYYTKDIIDAIEANNVTIDMGGYNQLCREIHIMYCTNEGCKSIGNDNMKNKAVTIYGLNSYNTLPYCIILCKSCGYLLSKSYIYTFK